MRENFDDRVKDWFPLKNDNLLVKLEDDLSADDYDEAKLVIRVPSRFGSYILPHSRRMMNDVIDQIAGFFSNSIDYTDTDSLHKHKKNWSDLVDNGFIGETLGLCEND